jgi:hypothetical protein
MRDGTVALWTLGGIVIESVLPPFFAVMTPVLRIRSVSILCSRCVDTLVMNLVLLQGIQVQVEMWIIAVISLVSCTILRHLFRSQALMHTCMTNGRGGTRSDR